MYKLLYHFSRFLSIIIPRGFDKIWCLYFYKKMPEQDFKNIFLTQQRISILTQQPKPYLLDISQNMSQIILVLMDFISKYINYALNK